MTYEKGAKIGGYTVSLLLKQYGETATYRVRDQYGRLYVMKCGASKSELDYACHTDLYCESIGSNIIYRHINGETLQARVRRLGALPGGEAHALTLDILRKLHRLHEAGYAHANLMADNIMIGLTTDVAEAWLVGLGEIKPLTAENAKEDILAVSRLINNMLTGETTHSDKVTVKQGRPSLLETVMIKATMGEFETVAEMISVLMGETKTKPVRRVVGPGFAAVAGMDELKQKLREEIIDVLADRKEAARYGITIPNGMLLYGPPGCGKTFLAEKFAEEAGYNYRYVKSSDLASVYIHGSQEKIGALFDEARADAPTILCFDEFDALVPRRNDEKTFYQSGEVNEFLSQLNNCGADGVFVIATTNRPDIIDPAVLRSGRIDHIIYVPVPDQNMRRELFKLTLKDRPVSQDVDYEKLAKISDYFVASDITAVTQEASRAAFKLRGEINMEMLLKAIESKKLSGITRTILSEYDKMREKFEKRVNQERRRVGFF